MRKLTIIISAMLVSLMFSAVPLLSAENFMRNETLAPKKDVCLLFARNCEDNVYQLQQRIDRLRGEIAKGHVIYSDGELNILRQKLDTANKALEFVLKDGA
jgi:hypothetical protein